MTKISAENRASITSPNPAERAAPVARFIAEHGKPPSDASPFWRSNFVHAHGPVPTDIAKSFGLGRGASWGDVGRAIDKALDPKSAVKPNNLHGWSEGSAADARAQLDADRMKASRLEGPTIERSPPPAVRGNMTERASS